MNPTRHPSGSSTSSDGWTTIKRISPLGRPPRIGWIGWIEWIGWFGWIGWVGRDPCGCGVGGSDSVAAAAAVSPLAHVSGVPPGACGLRVLPLCGSQTEKIHGEDSVWGMRGADPRVDPEADPEADPGEGPVRLGPVSWDPDLCSRYRWTPAEGPVEKGAAGSAAAGSDGVDFAPPVGSSVARWAKRATLAGGLAGAFTAACPFGRSEGVVVTPS